MVEAGDLEGLPGFAQEIINMGMAIRNVSRLVDRGSILAIPAILAILAISKPSSPPEEITIVLSSSL
jgi:hypothetical protein